MIRVLTLFLVALLVTPGLAFAQTQGIFDAPSGALPAAGWAGFTDYKFMANSVAALLLASLLGAAIGYHPTATRTVDTLREADLPKVYIMYAFVGAVIGVTVREFGMVIGLVVFGIGGLLRFRTDTGSTRDTGRLIAVTLAGLIAGLGLPHFAVITTVFTFVMIYLFDARPGLRLKVSQLPTTRFGEAAEAYRGVLQTTRCRIMRERHSAGKSRVDFIFRLPPGGTRERLHVALGEVSPDLRGVINWEVE
jgi:hypothetical protein